MFLKLRARETLSRLYNDLNTTDNNAKWVQLHNVLMGFL
jgi:hypothetical protein